ncbi:hypothetical protein [Halorubrum sp. Boch-26]|uniref:hypothetical protein n=1 Tax=Halorubrum sp. Boch-26 TaxID=2994426 RepID=UPI002468725E|nr:hypothetical protein [Halorubrum sp. Boch-26]
MSSREPTYRTLRLLCANAVGMAGFLLALALSREFAVALVAAVVLAGIGYTASNAVVAYASA